MSGKGRKVYIVGVGMTKFEKPGRRKGFDYQDFAKEAGVKALMDANLRYDDVEYCTVGYCYGDSTCGQRAVYQLGMTQIPIINVNNNCSTGSSAIYLARQAIEGGLYDCAIALGFEKMFTGSLKSFFSDRTNPGDWRRTLMEERRGIDPKAPPAAQTFGNAGIEYCERFGAEPVHMAKIAEKNHRHSALNPYSQFQDVHTLDEVVNSRKIFGPLTVLQCCPTSDGAGACILASEEFVKKHGLEPQAIEICAQVMATDAVAPVKTKSSMEVAGFSMTRRAAVEAYKVAGVTPKDIGVVELHDCFSANELITYDALQLCAPGEAHKLVDSGNTTFGGAGPIVNPSGGLISKGHPLGATGLAQTCEMVWQLRGWCGQRQVPNLTYALAHNVGLGGAVVVSIYKKAFPNAKPAAGYKDPRERFGYNPAQEARLISDDDLRKVVGRDGALAVGEKASLVSPKL